jgi:hypothetical protein
LVSAQSASFGASLRHSAIASASSRCASARLRRVEDGADAPRDRLALIELGDVGLRVLLQVKLAALPRHAGQYRAAAPL